MQLIVARSRRWKFLIAQAVALSIERDSVMGPLVAIHAADDSYA